MLNGLKGHRIPNDERLLCHRTRTLGSTNLPNRVLDFSGNSDGGVRLGMFFDVEWWWNYVDIRSGGRFMVDLWVQNCCCQ